MKVKDKKRFVFSILEKARRQTRELENVFSEMEKISRIIERRKKAGQDVSLYETKRKELEIQFDNIKNNRVIALRYIQMVDGIFYDILYSYYYLAMTWDKVSETIGYSERAVYYWRKKAINALLEKMKQEDFQNDVETDF